MVVGLGWFQLPVWVLISMNQRETMSDFETIIRFGLFFKKLNMVSGSPYGWNYNQSQNTCFENKCLEPGLTDS